MLIAEVKKNVGVEGIDVEGVIENVYDRSTGEGEFGEWSLQNIMLADSTGKIKCVLKNRDELGKACEGKYVKFSSNFNEKANKKVGVKIALNVYKGKETVELQATRSAGMEFINTPEAVVAVKENSDVRVRVEADKKDSMILSYAKDLTIACIEKGWYTDSISAAAGFAGWVNLLKQDGKLPEVGKEISPF